MQTETAIVGKPLNQTTLAACQAALTLDINSTGSSTYYGTTDVYRRQLAAAMVYKMFVRTNPAALVGPRFASAGTRFLRPVSSESSAYTSNAATAPVSSPVVNINALKQVRGSTPALEGHCICFADPVRTNVPLFLLKRWAFVIAWIMCIRVHTFV